MRIVKPSPTGHLKGIRNNPNPADNLKPLYQRLRNLLSQYRDRLRAERPGEWDYELWSRYGYRTKSNHPQNVRRVLFCSLSAYDEHLSFYFYPFSLDKEFTPEVSSPLTPNLKGKCTFHFTSMTLQQEAALIELLERGLLLYKRLHLI